MRLSPEGKIMRYKIVLSCILLAVMLLNFAMPSVRAGGYGFNDGKIDISVYYPTQAYPGDRISFRVRVEALEDLQDVDISIWVRGSKNEGYSAWSKYITILSDKDLSSGVVRDEDFTLTFPSDASPGLTYAIIYIHYKYYSWPLWYDSYDDDAFQMTYLKDKAYEDLLDDYHDLLNEYNQYKATHSHTNSEFNEVTNQRDYWKNEYESLNSTYNDYVKTHSYSNSKFDALENEASTSRSLNYLLIVTTIVFIGTTAFLAIKKPKTKREANIS